MATILIVDDARSTLRALEVILKREGYTAVSYTHLTLPTIYSV